MNEYALKLWRNTGVEQETTLRNDFVPQKYDFSETRRHPRTIVQ